MFKFVKNNPKIIWGAIIAIMVFIALSIWQKQQYMSNPYENQIGNPAREAQAIEDDYYYNQLSEKEMTAYDALKSAVVNFQGGEFVFPEKLNGKEYSRVAQAIQCGNDDLFYAIIDVPMTKDNQGVSYIESNVTDVKDSIIEKCIILLYPAEGLDINGDVDDDGYVKNLDELKTSLLTMNEEKKTQVENMIQIENQKIEEVVNGLPQEYGKKEAVDYFLKWMDENLELDNEIMESTENVKNMTDAFEKIYFESNSSCIVDGKATAAGYTRLLAKMCNMSGIETHTVMGNWSNSNAYTLAYMKFDDKVVYVDASGYKKSDLWEQRYISETLMARKMTVSNIFE